MKETTVRLTGQELSDFLGVSRSGLSRAVRKDYKASGYRVSEWADWHHNGRRVEGYDIPAGVAREIIPDEEWDEYCPDGLFSLNALGSPMALSPTASFEGGRRENPRPLPLELPPKDAAQYAAQLLRALEDVEQLEGLWLNTVANELERFSKTDQDT